MEHIKNTVTEFLVTTPIHGFRYLHEGRNVLEKLSWLIVLLASFSITSYMINQNMEEARKHPILTTFDTIDVAKVPFPAITIESNGFIDRWGFSEKLFNLLLFYNVLDPAHFNQSKALRDKFDFLAEKAWLQMWQVLKENKTGWSLEQLQYYGQNSIPVIKNHFAKVTGIAERLAAIMRQDPQHHQEIMTNIHENFKQDFFRYDRYDMFHFLDKMDVITKAAMNTSKLLENTLESCNKQVINCTQELIQALIETYQPFELFPMNDMDVFGLGSLMKHLQWQSDGFFLDHATASPEEIIARKWMNQALIQIMGNDSSVSNISIYEFVQLFHAYDSNVKPPRAYDPFLVFLRAEHDCEMRMQFMGRFFSTGLPLSGIANYSDPMCTVSRVLKDKSLDNCCQLTKKFEMKHETVLKVFR